MKNSRTALNGRSAFSITLKNGVSVVALGALAAALAMPALAQDAPAADPDVTEVVVTGQRAQIKSAQRLKRDSAVVQDSITAVDIGALPDRSVSEALQRISGLQIQRTNENRDPARLAAEGGSVNIRGLSWVRSETNGRDIFSAKNGRGLSFEDVSADLLAGVDVFKNPSADMIEGGIGGTVNLRTRLPFDSKKRILAVNFDSNYGDIEEKAHQSGSFIYSDRWETGIGEVGGLLNLSYSDVGNRTDSLSVDRFDTTVDDTGATVYIPNSIGWRSVTWNQKRTGINGALQWRPNDQWEVALQAMYAKVEAENTEYALGSYDGSFIPQGAAAGNDFVYDSNGVFQSGTVPSAGYDANTRYGEDEKKTTDVSLNVKYYASDKLSFVADLQYVKSTADILSMTAYTELADKPAISVNLAGDTPVIKVTGTTDDPSRYYWAAAMDHIEENEGTQYSFKLDGLYEFDDNWLKSFKFGVRATDKDYVTRQSGWNWGLLSNQYWLNASDPAYITDAGQGPGLDGAEYVTFNNFFRGDANVPGSVWFPSASVVNGGTAHAYDLLQSTQTSGWGWAPLSDDWGNYKPGSDNVSGGVNNQKEETKAVYGLLSFGNDDVFGGKSFDGNVGVRVVKTEATAEGFTISTASTNAAACDYNGSVPVATCNLANAAVQFVATNMQLPVQAQNNYTDVLPSLNLRLKYNDQLQFRFAASKAIVRPELYQTNAYTSIAAGLTKSVDGNGVQTGYTVSLTGTGGNPYLRPIKANQYDLTAEWYFAPTGSLTLALFKKDLTDYIYSGSELETYTNNGQTLQFNVGRYVNGSEGKVDGFEIAYSQFYDFLPGFWSGFGVQANYTKINSSGGKNPLVNIFDGNQVVAADLNGLPLEGMSPTSYNAAIMYEKYGISARLAYNWREEYLLTTSGANINRPVWSEDYGQLDGSVFYSINEKYKIGLQGTNLNQATTYLRVSNLDNLSVKPRYNWVATDRRIAIVLRASF
ncbi:TonB-dependent receptor [Asticcacaulis sp. ZE23SCel15]|uniref:TonB-dependent receptor n=1 Tax=Asticcacaulis sp. ZE23SCel15 TaxID=3059027 RepID=UPI00265E14AC|nr:TonB-dependent receptor [Asticcacaulis sp. ZE23SCel15]WKL58909.1 TonB-dependent receptor [Asticcacaulis sp. ZE23SCel15]